MGNEWLSTLIIILLIQRKSVIQFQGGVNVKTCIELNTIPDNNTN